MTLEALETILRGTGLPVTYREWPVGHAPALPYICYLQVGDDNDAADGIVYYSAKRVRIELYTVKKSPAVEKLITDALTSAGIYYTTEEDYIDEERFYQIIYEIEV